MPRRIGRKGKARTALALAIEPHEFIGNLPDGLARTRLGLRPVAPAHLVHARGLAADVLRHLVELVARDVEAITRLALLRTCVLDDEVFAGRALIARAYGAARHLHEPPDSVVIVNDIVSGRQLERIDHRAATCGKFLATGSASGRFPRHVSLTQEHEFDVLEEDPLGDRPRRDAHVRAGKLLVEISAEPRRDTRLSERLGDVAPGTRSRGREDDSPSVTNVLREVPRRIRDRAAVSRVRFRLRREVGIEPERGKRGDREVSGLKLAECLLERREACLRHIDRHGTALCCTRPRRLKELFRCAHELIDTRANTFGLNEHEARMLGK